MTTPTNPDTCAAEPSSWDRHYAITGDRLEQLSAALLGLGPIFGEPIVRLLADLVDVARAGLTMDAVQAEDAADALADQRFERIAVLAEELRDSRRWVWNLLEHLQAVTDAAQHRRARTRPALRRPETELFDALRALENGREFYETIFPTSTRMTTTSKEPTK